MKNSNKLARLCGRAVRAPKALVICVGLLACGCQHYERQPLNMIATRDAWLARSPSDETARQFASRLADAEGRSDAVFDPSDGLTLAEAEPVALVFNRELRLARLKANVSRATADNAGLWEDPVLGVGLERIVSSVPDPWVVSGTVGLTIPISGRLSVEKARAGAEHAAELQRLAATEWVTRASLRQLWVQWSAEKTRMSLANDLVSRLQSVEELANRHQQAGVMSRIDSRLFSVELAGNQADLIAAMAKVKELELQLRDVMGLSPQATVNLVETIGFTTETDSASLRTVMETNNPELAAIRSEYEVAEESLRLEIRKQYPDLVIGPGYGTDQGDERVLLGIQLPLPLWNRNRQSVAQALANRDVARGRFESSYEHLASQLEIAQARFNAGRSMRESIESRVLPLADEQDADVRRVAELGRVDPLVTLQTIKSQYAAKVRLVDAKLAEAIGAIRIDELVGPVRKAPTVQDSKPTDRHTPLEGGRP